MLSKKDKEEVLRLRTEEGLTYEAIHKQKGWAINTIMNVCKGIAEDQEAHFDDPIDKVRAISGAIDNLIEKEQLKGEDRAELEKRKEDIREILRVEVDERIAGERKDAVEERDEQWQEILGDKDAAIKGLTNTINDKDADIKGRTNTINEKNRIINEGKTNLAILWETNADLSNYIGDYLEVAGRRERRSLEKDRGDFIVEKTEFRQYAQETKKLINDRKEELNNKISEEERLRKEDIERKKELDELQERINEDAKENKIMLDEGNELYSKSNNVLIEIKREQYWLDKKLEKLERLESVQSREKNVGWQEKNIEEKEQKLKEKHKTIDFTEILKKEPDNFKRVKLEPA